MSGIGPGASKASPTGAIVVEPVAPAAAALAAEAPWGPEADASGGSDITSSHSWDLSYTDPRGHRWDGRFRCHILTIQDRVKVGLTRARMLGNTPVSALDAATVQLAEIQAHLAVAVDEAPPWAKDLHTFRDVGLVYAVYEEVTAHEERFHSPPAKSDSDSGGGDAPGAG